MIGCRCEQCSITEWLVTYYADADDTEPVEGIVEGADRFEAMRNFGWEHTGAVLVNLERKVNHA